MKGEQIKRSGATKGFGIRDGHGVVFVSNTGDICPAGFLPLGAGNVRKDRLVDVYRNAPLFRALHDPAQFEGRCGVCEFNALCGGSRARAFAATGNPCASDPLCIYEPREGRSIQ
jgi:radical SAM protein with 4Fe4S-binding SPASM domain